MLLVLMTSWLRLRAPDNRYDLLEFFAGSARIARLAKARGYSSVAVDLLYDTTAPPPKTKRKACKGFKNSKSAMDINTSAGFVLLVLFRLQGSLVILNPLP